MVINSVDKTKHSLKMFCQLAWSFKIDNVQAHPACKLSCKLNTLSPATPVDQGVDLDLTEQTNPFLFFRENQVRVANKEMPENLVLL